MWEPRDAGEQLLRCLVVYRLGFASGTPCLFPITGYTHTHLCHIYIYEVRSLARALATLARCSAMTVAAVGEEASLGTAAFADAVREWVWTTTATAHPMEYD